eukprot:TRINITY_DN2264_c0_g1_i3.p1 TRINITY_DN2264_c0_g1~~TRINITY_DN2264_c0_g1_i3.p1  ORF type:complete len:131 (-),score=15.73 TRINITY_DN2264_c0_g1_i3:530-922(-)
MIIAIHLNCVRRLLHKPLSLMRTPPRLDSSLIGQGLQLYYETSGRKTALLIANGNGGNIQTVCREDAGAMSTVLESLGFIVSLHRDLDSSAILEIAKEFSSSKRTDCFLFYSLGMEIMIRFSVMMSSLLE